MTNVTLPNNITEISFAMLLDCPSLTSVTIPKGVTNIAGHAFDSCASLTNVTIPSGVVSLGEGAFQGSGLTSVAIPRSVTHIGPAAFANCVSLTSVTIPSSVTSIEDYIFFQSTRLTSVYFEGDVHEFADTMFAGGVEATVYYLPDAKGWDSTFGGRPTALWLPRIVHNDGGFGVRANQFGFNIVWASDKVVTVEACTDLANPIWTPVGLYTLAGGSSYFSDADFGNHSARLYRLRQSGVGLALSIEGKVP